MFSNFYLDDLGINYRYDTKSYDILGIPIPKKTKSTDPYNYDTFIIWHDKYKKYKGAVYTDRLFQEDHKKTEELCTKHLKSRWELCEKDELTNFMREWMSDNTIEVIALAETCHAQSGHPIHIIFYNQKKKKRK
ncbi:MAG: hypothetical protein M0R03_11490 [Novosphingobium sp.]|nr:hypothetical protein [Novosphingobium sp.]